MASVRRTLSTILILVIVAVIAAAGAIGYGAWQKWSTARELQHIHKQLAEGKAQEAETALAALGARIKPGHPALAEWLELRLEALEALNDTETAGQLAVQALDAKKPWVVQGQPAWVRAHHLLGQRELGKENLDAAREHFDLLARLKETEYGHIEGQLGLGLADLATPGKVEAGRDRLAALLEILPANHPMRPNLENALGRANMFLLMSPEIHAGDEFYEIKARDTLDGLHRRFNVATDLLKGVNQISNVGNLRIGQRIKIPRLNLSIVVNKADNTLTLLNNGKFFKKYRCRTGQYEASTPVGEFTIRNKMVNPNWTDPKTGQRYAGGDPNNQLGSRWMEVAGQIGIHEAIDPATVGTYSSNGCVGLVRADVEELYNLVSNGTPVKITGRQSGGAAAGGALSGSELTAPMPRRSQTNAVAPVQAPAQAPVSSAAPAATSAAMTQATPAPDPTRSSAPARTRSRYTRSRTTPQEGTRR